MGDPFVELRRVLMDAVDQDAGGKGVERHAGGGEPFEEQQICQLQRWIGDSPVGGSLFQVCKKAIESARLPPERAIKELRGSVVYASAAILLLEERMGRAVPPPGASQVGTSGPPAPGRELHRIEVAPKTRSAEIAAKWPVSDAFRASVRESWGSSRIDDLLKSFRAVGRDGDEITIDGPTGNLVYASRLGLFREVLDHQRTGGLGP